MLPAQVGALEVGRVARVEHLGAVALQREHLVEGRAAAASRSSASSSVGRSWRLSTASYVKYAGSLGLVGRDDADEVVLAHRLQGVVRAAAARRSWRRCPC